MRNYIKILLKKKTNLQTFQYQWNHLLEPNSLKIKTKKKTNTTDLEKF